MDLSFSKTLLNLCWERERESAREGEGEGGRGREGRGGKEGKEKVLVNGEDRKLA